MMSFFFFFQAEDGIRDYKVTGVQTCALPILVPSSGSEASVSPTKWWLVLSLAAATVALAVGTSLWFRAKEYFWRNPIAGARFQTVTDFDGVAQAAAISRDGQFVAFLSDRDGPMDAWVTQAGSGRSEEHTSELQSPCNLVCRLLL